MYHLHKFQKTPVAGNDPKGLCAQCDARQLCEEETEKNKQLGLPFGKNIYFKRCKQDRPGDGGPFILTMPKDENMMKKLKEIHDGYHTT